MPRGCDHSVHVHVDVTNPEKKLQGRQPKAGRRRFIVEFNADGEVVRIKEVKQLKPPQIGIYHRPYWTAGTHPLPGMPERIIAAARAKILAEHRSADATP